MKGYHERFRADCEGSRAKRQIHEPMQHRCSFRPVDSLTYNWVELSTEYDMGEPAIHMSGEFKTIEPMLLWLIAESPIVCGKTLEVLAFHHSASVRQAVCGNQRTPLATLTKLANDQNPEVRFVLAKSRNTPGRILRLLANDECPYVRLRAELSLTRTQDSID